jgi:uncharacterized membrane-anchored protein YitT (DUF2179 family)
MFNKALHTRWVRVLLLLLSSLLAAWTVNTFVVPQHLYSGGLLGLCQVIRTVLVTKMGLTMGSTDIAGVLYLVANIPLLILAWRALGHTFVFKLILCTVSNSLFMTLIPVPLEPVVSDRLTSCLVAALLNGLAYGTMLTCGGSTGGVDILGLYLSKKRGITVGRLGIAFNVCVYGLCLILFDASTVIYSAIQSMTSSLFVDRMHQQNITSQALIITKEAGQEVPNAILGALDRGVTYWEGRGAYTGDGVRVLCVCLSKYEIETLQQAVHRVDPNAFIMIQEGVHTSGNFARHLE